MALIKVSGFNIDKNKVNIEDKKGTLTISSMELNSIEDIIDVNNFLISETTSFTQNPEFSGYKDRNNEELFKYAVVNSSDDVQSWEAYTTLGDCFKKDTSPIISIIKGTSPHFTKAFHTLDYSNSTIYLERTPTSLKICSTNFIASDFDDNTIPSRIIVVLQGGGGGGASSYNLVAGACSGAGGGAGGCVIGVIDLIKYPKIGCYVGAGGAGGSAPNNVGSGGVNTVIVSGSTTLAYAYGGGAGGKGDAFGAGSGHDSPYITVINSLTGANGGAGSTTGNINGKSGNNSTLTAATVGRYALDQSIFSFGGKNGGSSNGYGGGGGASGFADGAAGGGNGSLGSGGGGGGYHLSANPGGAGGNGFIKFYY